MVTRDPDDLLDALFEALTVRADCRGVARGDLELLDVGGIAHDHVRIRGYRIDGVPVLLRVPRLSQWGLEADDNLTYQRTCFARALPSGSTPRLLGVLPVSHAVPMGALLVQEIAGRKPRLPDDMAAIARTLARIHTLPVPPHEDRAPLRVHENAVAGTLATIETQADFIDATGIAPAARAMIEEEIAWARDFAVESAPSQRILRLVATDAHPGNFLVTPDGGGDGRAVFVDLEKMLYGAPAIDLAHASLHTSTMWDPEIATTLADDDIAAFHAAYFEAAGPALADGVRPWVLPMRRLTWLRTLTWCIRWRVLSARAEDWSADLLDPATRAHVESTIADYLTPERIEAIRGEWRGERLASALS